VDRAALSQLSNDALVTLVLAQEARIAELERFLGLNSSDTVLSRGMELFAQQRPASSTPVGSGRFGRRTAWQRRRRCWTAAAPDTIKKPRQCLSSRIRLDPPSCEVSVE
jgi:hypothetical protein